ncbi:MAG: ribosome biogenesis GTP-binding protein YihA/YsxC [Candidatus Tectimicrobiota bacterium]
MKILSAAFLASAVAPEQYPRQPLPEVAFAGRSNVGKSSLINTLVHRKNLVKTSATPGKTQAINFFVVNEQFFLVDLPGYGYARVPREVQAHWRPMIETYLRQRTTLRAVVHIVDLRHPPTEQDQQLRVWLLHHRHLTITVATKADQVKRSQRAGQIEHIRRGLALLPEEPVLLFSSQNREGRFQLWGRLEALLSAGSHVPPRLSPTGPSRS